MNSNDIIDENMEVEIDEVSSPPKYYEAKIAELDQRYNLIMNELSQNYRNNKNTNADQKNIEKLQNELFLLKNMMLNNIETVSNNIGRYDKRINAIMKQNAELKKKYEEIKQKNSGAKGFAKDTQVMYRQYYGGNVLIGLIALSSVVVYQVYFKNSETVAV